MDERWHLGTWLEKRFRTEEHIVARKGDGIVIRFRAVEAMHQETTLDDLDAIKGSPWASSGVLRDVLLEFPRPILSRDEPPFVPVEERPVPRNMKISQDIQKKFGYTPGCASLAHSQDCRTRIEAASRTDLVYRDGAEGAEQRKMDFYAKEVERIGHPRRVSLEPSVVLEPSTEEKDIPRSDPEGEDHSSAQEKTFFRVQMRR